MYILFMIVLFLYFDERYKLSKSIEIVYHMAKSRPSDETEKTYNLVNDIVSEHFPLLRVIIQWIEQHI